MYINNQHIFTSNINNFHKPDLVATNYVTGTPGWPLYPVASYLNSFSFQQDASNPVLKAFIDSAVKTASYKLF